MFKNIEATFSLSPPFFSLQSWLKISLVTVMIFFISSCMPNVPINTAKKKTTPATKTTSSSIKLWTQQLLHPGHAIQNRGIAKDSAGNIYISGMTEIGLEGNIQAGVWDSFVVKYNSLGVRQWAQQYGETGLDFNAKKMTTDSLGNVYVLGEIRGRLDQEADFFVIKYNPAGIKQWIQMKEKSINVIVEGVATDSTNNVYITGTTYQGLDGNVQIGNSNFFIRKYNSDGVKQWTKQLGFDGMDTSGAGIAVDPLSNVYITGTMGSFVTGWSFVYKYTSNGVLQWSQNFGEKSSSSNNIAIDSAGNVYMAGITWGGLDGNALVFGGEDFFIMKYNSAGTKQWTRVLGNKPYLNTKPMEYDHSVNGLAFDSANNVYITGGTSGGIDGKILSGVRDYFVSKYNPNGIKQWTLELGVSNEMATSYGAVTDLAGNVYIAGDLTLGYDGKGVDSIATFISKYSSSGVEH